MTESKTQHLAMTEMQNRAPLLTPLGTYMRSGRGVVPATSLASAAWKRLCEIPTISQVDVISKGAGSQLDFTADGMSLEQFRAFFDASMAAAKKVEPICEAGNKYSVDHHFVTLNGELLLHEIKMSAMYEGLSGSDRKRADQFFEIMCLEDELRNRNPLHPNPLDSAVIANLLNFPKHIFGFPFGCYATNGNESLSLVLFSYRAERLARKLPLANARVVYVMAEGEALLTPDVEACASRLSMPFDLVRNDDLRSADLGQAAVVMCDFANPKLEQVVAWAAQAGVAVHIHVLDRQFRAILSQDVPVHFELPKGVRSISIENGFFRSGFQLYRDTELRDLHFDLPFEWSSQYLSPNEGGSGNTTPLYIDFCFILLGWSALRGVASQTTGGRPTEANLENYDRLQPRLLSPFQGADTVLEEQVPRTLEGVMEWGKKSMQLPRKELEEHVLQFQRHFAGGKNRSVEVVTSGGGTRSIQYAFETVLKRARMAGMSHVKCITGDPHLAVERAERRLLFEVVRVHQDGVLCLKGLKQHIQDPCLLVVYVQTLSITDGITDPLSEAIAIIEEENQRRKRAAESNSGGSYLPITLITDSCLAFSVLLHNDGERYGPECLRVLDLTQDCITPTIMTQDAHKHLGADKGISMAMGTPGTLSLLDGHVKVGSQPTRGELVRCMADMLLVGREGYHEKYNRLAAAVDDATKKIEAAGMHIVHGQYRVRGSTAFTVEDPSARIQRMLKKCGHGPSPAFKLNSPFPDRCQTGFLMSLTPHGIREMKPGMTALDIFVADSIESHKKAMASPSCLAKLFREDSLMAILLSGGLTDLWLFAQLREAGVRRDVSSLILRRLFTAIYDSGVVCSQKQQAPVQSLLARITGLVCLVALGGFMLTYLSRGPVDVADSAAVLKIFV